MFLANFFATTKPTIVLAFWLYITSKNTKNSEVQSKRKSQRRRNENNPDLTLKSRFHAGFSNKSRPEIA